MRDISPENWALHDWLSKAYFLGLKHHWGIPAPLAYAAFFGPNWKEEVEAIKSELFHQYVQGRPHLFQFEQLKRAYGL